MLTVIFGISQNAAHGRPPTPPPHKVCSGCPIPNFLGCGNSAAHRRWAVAGEQPALGDRGAKPQVQDPPGDTGQQRA